MEFGRNDGTKSPFSKWRDPLDLIFNQGGPGMSHFAITNLCDAKCKFCDFAVGNISHQDLRSVSRQDGIRSIDILYDNGIRYIQFVGGEALLHKDILTFVKYAHEKGMTTMICTNGGRLTEECIFSLKEAGLNSIFISIDAPSIAVHEENRGIRNLGEKICHANDLLKKVNIPSTASVTISKLISDYDRLPEFLKDMGFSHVTFSYPLEYLGSSYLGSSKSGLVKYTAEELIAIFEKIKNLKKKFHIVNNRVSLSEMQCFLRKEPQRFSCLGGYRYFLLDWNLDVYRCHYWEHPICKIHEFGPEKFIRDDCTRCMIDCYRDASVLQYLAVSLTDTLQSIKMGNYGKACKTLFTRNNLSCLGAILEQLPWIRKI
jgi:MoaA/NifB/PqqE/SkfB family radical SAM enzyme